MDKKNIKGLKDFIAGLEKASEALIAYTDRHKRLLKEALDHPKCDPLASLQGFMYVQHDLVEALRVARLDAVLKKALESKEDSTYKKSKDF